MTANPDAATVQAAPDAAAEDPAAHPKLGTIILLGSLTAIAAMSIDLYLPSLPAIGREFAVDAPSVQRTMSAFFIGMAAGGLIYGPASDRFGRRPALLAGIAVYFLASLACAVAPTIDWLIAGRFAQALGACSGQVIARAVVRDRYHHQDSARIFSLLTLVLGVAPMVAPTIGAWLVTFATWRAIFAVLAAVAVVIGVAVATRLTESRSAVTAAQAAGESVVGSFAALLRQKRLIGYLLAGSLNGATLFTYIASAPDLLITQYGFSARAFAFAFAVIAVGVIGSSQVNRGLLGRFDSNQILGVAGLIGALAGVGLVIAAFTGGQWPTLVMLFTVLSSYGFIAANATAGALGVDPLRAGAASALIGSASFAVGAVAATIAGMFHDGTPRPMAVVMAVALAGAALALHTLALTRRVAAG
jgi:DHA1 family bicyclomycin/chloramphenicol resistance-like MFS transporter